MIETGYNTLFPYVVSIPFNYQTAGSLTHYAIIDKWCTERFGTQASKWIPIEEGWAFANLSDAVLIELTWGWPTV